MLVAASTIHRWSRRDRRSGSGGPLTEDRLAVMEVWSHRVFKGLDDSNPLSDMLNTKDEFVVCQLEFPLGEGSDRQKAASAVPASPSSAAAYVGSSSLPGQAPSQGTGETDVEGGGGGGGGEATVLIDLVLATHTHSALKGRPLRIACKCVYEVSCLSVC